MTTIPLPPPRLPAVPDAAAWRPRSPAPSAAAALRRPAAPRWQLVTIVTADRRPLFGHVIGGRMHLGLAGRHALEGWLEAVRARPWLVADVFIVMPDHIHGLVAPQADAPQDDRTPRGSPVFARTVEGFALGAKALIARRLRQSGIVGPRATVWQAGVELHQVRGQAELEALRRHVRENPLRWWRRLGYGFPTPGMAAASDRVAEREPLDRQPS